MSIKTILGNEAIGLGLVENSCRVATAYPGTPSSEILAGVVKYKKYLGREVYTEWSSNEKVAFEIALAASWSGLRAAVAMKQVGLNVAADPFFSAAYTGVEGGFIIIPADDPGPYSSQTEQDSRLMAINAKVPVFDPSNPAEARAMVADAFALSEQFHIPVIIRPTTRLCHAIQTLPLTDNPETDPAMPKVHFRKNPPRWTATPKFRNLLHHELTQKLANIQQTFERSPLNYVTDSHAESKVGIIASGVAFHTAQQAMQQLGLQVPIFKIGTPYPLPQILTSQFIEQFDAVVVIEEPDTCIELQISNRKKVHGRLDGSIPSAGELLPEVVYRALAQIFQKYACEVNPMPGNSALEALVKDLPLPIRKPRLCPGCSHRSAFYVMKRTFGPRAIYPGDIGCYTLGMNLRAVDTFVDMGASITMADGLFQAGQLVQDNRPIIASIGDSTFLHSGVPALINAVHTGARFVLVILDNHTTAMTGFQPTAASEQLADGSQAARKVSIPDLVRACGVTFVREIDPYDQPAFEKVLRQANEHSQSAAGNVAVIIANRPCRLFDPTPLQEHPVPVEVTEECDGCRFCVEAFECPALVLNTDQKRVDIDHKTCIDCGQCIDACYKGFIVATHLAEVVL